MFLFLRQMRIKFCPQRMTHFDFFLLRPPFPQPHPYPSRDFPQSNEAFPPSCWDSLVSFDGSLTTVYEDEAVGPPAFRATDHAADGQNGDHHHIPQLNYAVTK